MKRAIRTSTPPELRVTITVETAGGTHAVLIRRPGEAPTSAAIAHLVHALEALGADAMDASSYSLRCDRLGEVLDNDATLIAQGVGDGDRLDLILSAPPARTPFPRWHSPVEEAKDRPEPEEYGSSGVDDDVSHSEVAPSRSGHGRLVLGGLLVIAAVAVGLTLSMDGNTASSSSIAPQVTPGRYLQLASFRERRNAERFALQVRAHHLHARVIASDAVDTLYPDWQVVAIGPLASMHAEQAMIRRVHQAGFSDALARTYEPTERRQSPPLLAGRYSGTLERVNPHHSQFRRDVRVAVTLGATGLGRIRYVHPTCIGTLKATADSPNRRGVARANNQRRMRSRRAVDHEAVRQSLGHDLASGR